MKIRNYEDSTVTVLHASPTKLFLQAAAVSMTTSKEFPVYTGEAMHRLLKYVITAQHFNLLDHLYVTFSIEGVSRAFMAQITRHRIAAYTCSSQHYSDYSDMPMVIDDRISSKALPSLIKAMSTYNSLLTSRVPKEEARQVLPNASAVNMIMTVNWTSLINMAKQRLCGRNVKEMQVVMRKIVEALAEADIPLAYYLGPYCFYDKRCECNQGKYSCGQPVKENIYDV